MTGPTTSDPRAPGPLDRATATALLAPGGRAAGGGRVRPARGPRTPASSGCPTPALTAAALVGAGEALYRLDDEEGARQCWEQATRLPENPVTYRALRQVAAARVRDGDLRGARDAYREAERRAPAAERAEIASRLGWLSKELGDTRAARAAGSRAAGAGQPDAGGDLRDHRHHARRLVPRLPAGRQRPPGRALARQAGPRGGGVVAPRDPRARARQRAPPRLQHVLPVPRRPDRGAALRVAPVRPPVRAHGRGRLGGELPLRRAAIPASAPPGRSSACAASCSPSRWCTGRSSTAAGGRS